MYAESTERNLGILELSDLPPAPRGLPQIEITIEVDSNGIVGESALDLAGVERRRSM